MARNRCTRVELLQCSIYRPLAVGIGIGFRADCFDPDPDSVPDSDYRDWSL